MMGPTPPSPACGRRGREAPDEGILSMLCSLRRCRIIAASTPPSLRAQRSNPGATARGPWIASSQGLLAMTVNGGVRVPRVDFLISGLRLIPPPVFTGRGKGVGRVPLPETFRALLHHHREPHPRPLPVGTGRGEPRATW